MTRFAYPVHPVHQTGLKDVLMPRDTRLDMSDSKGRVEELYHRFAVVDPTQKGGAEEVTAINYEEPI